ncbi:helix-turn-helix transcriptional regulator [Flavobacterium sp. MC2016-06]|jgi:AraC family transcriptional activator of pobA|uniref:helix-turn-helix domain-containing protein n=1 Tax=Flavobacterium sp. MC2016-06 TaxID=2676308 RepID=UPI0012BAF835|nr:helix-turn-helix transcriptional regulator [Flavobacterium sp. MC2016-06]MBU3859298.1 helix-turn-helix transcriptional regulator [Flavobacterium sp. MC2016-06]
MKKEVHPPHTIHSISEMHELLKIPKPDHPLVSFVNLSNISCSFSDNLKTVIYDFYTVSIKRNFKGKMKYGQHYYDFDEGVMTFMSPGQIISTEVDEDTLVNGSMLVIHPDFIQSYALAKNIKDFTFFSYAVHEALHLSEKEEIMITGIMQNIEQEYLSSIDAFSQDVMISHIELLLNYCNRFYNRQFLTRKSANNTLLAKLETLLSDYFESDKVQQFGLPTVAYLSEQLNVSPNYLSDMLRSLTGQSTQYHIHNKIIEKAKELLTTTSLSVSEMAYQLGFEYPQSFNKLFKSKTNVSPLEFRSSFN